VGGKTGISKNAVLTQDRAGGFGKIGTPSKKTGGGGL